VGRLSLYAPNLFDLADRATRTDRLTRSRARPDASSRSGMHAAHPAQCGETEPRQALVIVERRDREAFADFLAEPELADLHPLREDGTGVGAGGWRVFAAASVGRVLGWFSFSAFSVSFRVRL
jgi:hypothetical protein